jgi:formylglycine-generating enzyme required for sulfatase activity/N-acetylneuraminic acid mutarotase
MITVTLIKKVNYDSFSSLTNPLTNKHNRTIMRIMKYIGQMLLLMLGMVVTSQAVPPVLNYAGQVAVNGEAYDGNGLFKFALVNADGTTTYWSNDGSSVNGSEPQASVSVPVNGGLYSLLLGNTALKGMGAIDPAVFVKHTDAKLRVWFSDGVNGFQQLSPDRPFASVPYAFSAGTAQSATIADGSINKAMLGSDLLTDLNAPIGMSRLSTEVTEKLNQEKTTTNNYNAPSVGSLLAVPYGSDAPAGYSLYQQGTPKELVWEEKAPVNKARAAYDGVEVLNGKIYFVGDYNDTGKNNTIERYDPETNLWETLSSANEARAGVASTVLDGKIYAIGGIGLSSVEVYDPDLDSWTFATPLPRVVARGTAVTFENKIYLFGGHNENGTDLNQVLVFDNSNNQWSQVSTMPSALTSFKAITFNERIWLIGGSNNMGNSSNTIARNYVRSYDVGNNTWHSESSLPQARMWISAWSLNSSLIVAGGASGNNAFKDIFGYDPNKKTWNSIGHLSDNAYAAGSVVFGSSLYLISGLADKDINAQQNKVFVTNLFEDVYDLYRKDGNAPVGTPVVQSEYADGSVTASKMAEGSVSKSALDATILKYLKPEITSQPQALTVYADTNASFSVTAEGKYLTYQWKKDGVNLPGETNATLTITDANATLHDGNYSVVVSNDFGSIESNNFKVNFEHRLELNATVTMDMIWCPPATFTMGSPTTEAGRVSDETQHQVTLTNGFYLGKYEVTQAQYEAVMTGVTGDRNATPSQFHGYPNRPVETVSWDDAQVFLTRLNEQQAGNLPAGWSYVLPTESQWEYACRAGTTSRYSWGNSIASTNANYNWDSGPTDGSDFKQTRNVGQYPANLWGFFDMHGNVWEWVSDWQAAYSDGFQTNPKGPASGSYRVKRGGAWYTESNYIRSARRNVNNPVSSDSGLGFRVSLQKS